MPIYKKHRSLSEKTTSIEDPIEVVQRGVITFIPSKATGAFLLPTQITNPLKVTINPMDSLTAQAINSGSVGAAHWWTDLKLYHATNAASSCFGSIASIASLDEVGKRLRIADGKLYVAAASNSAIQAYDAVVEASTAHWRQLEEFGSNAQKYLLVHIPNTASAYFILKKMRLSYEVIGYEY